MCWTHYKLPTYLTLWPTDVQDVAYLWSAACAAQIPAIKLSDKTGDERLRARIPWLTRCPRGNNRQAVAALPKAGRAGLLLYQLAEAPLRRLSIQRPYWLLASQSSTRR